MSRLFAGRRRAAGQDSGMHEQLRAKVQGGRETQAVAGELVDDGQQQRCRRGCRAAGGSTSQQTVRQSGSSVSSFQG